MNLRVECISKMSHSYKDITTFHNFINSQIGHEGSVKMRKFVRHKKVPQNKHNFYFYTNLNENEMFFKHHF